MPETFDEQLQLLRDFSRASYQEIPQGLPRVKLQEALAELLRRWDQQMVGVCLQCGHETRATKPCGHLDVGFRVTRVSVPQTKRLRSTETEA
jgi:hypothetical protein